jgi:hypothetical protein
VCKMLMKLTTGQIGQYQMNEKKPFEE